MKEFLAGFGTLHDVSGSLELFGVMRPLRVVVLLILTPHGLLSLCSAVSEPLSDVKFACKLQYKIRLRNADMEDYG